MDGNHDPVRDNSFDFPNGTVASRSRRVTRGRPGRTGSPPCSKTWPRSRNRSTASPVGSAAASSSRRLLSAGSASTRRRNISSALPGTITAPGKPNPRPTGTRPAVARTLLQRSERQLHLRLTTGHADHATVSGALHQELKECRLADTRLAMQHQRPALAAAHGSNELFKHSAFQCPVNQRHGTSRAHRQRRLHVLKANLST
jgi:hypothetical protein